MGFIVNKLVDSVRQICYSYCMVQKPYNVVEFSPIEMHIFKTLYKGTNMKTVSCDNCQDLITEINEWGEWLTLLDREHRIKPKDQDLCCHCAVSLINDSLQTYKGALPSPDESTTAQKLDDTLANGKKLAELQSESEVDTAADNFQYQEGFKEYVQATENEATEIDYEKSYNAKLDFLNTSGTTQQISLAEAMFFKMNDCWLFNPKTELYVSGVNSKNKDTITVQNNGDQMPTEYPYDLTEPFLELSNSPFIIEAVGFSDLVYLESDPKLRYYKVERTDPLDGLTGCFKSFVVVAESYEQARKIHPLSKSRTAPILAREVHRLEDDSISGGYWGSTESLIRDNRLCAEVWVNPLRISKDLKVTLMGTVTNKDFERYDVVVSSMTE